MKTFFTFLTEKEIPPAEVESFNTIEGLTFVEARDLFEFLTHISSERHILCAVLPSEGSKIKSNTTQCCMRPIDILTVGAGSKMWTPTIQVTPIGSWGEISVFEKILELGSKLAPKDLVRRLASRAVQLGFVQVLTDLQKDENFCKTNTVEEAAANGHMDMVVYLIDVVEIDPTFGALLKAVRNNDLEMVELFIAHGVNHREKEDLALQVAVDQGFFSLASFLMDLGADIKPHLVKSLRWAVMLDKSHVVRFLLEHGVEVPEVDFINSAHKNSRKIVELFLEFNVKPTPECLRNAAEQGNTEMVRTLLNAGMDVQDCGIDAFKWALTDRKDQSLANLMKERGFRSV